MIEREVLIEAMAEAFWDALDHAICLGDDRPHRPNPIWGDRPDPPDDFDRWSEFMASRVLDTLLALRRTVPCPECRRNEPPNYSECAPDPDCPSCQGSGSVDTGPALVLREELEQVGIVAEEPAMNGVHRMYTSHVREPRKYNEKPVFILRPRPEEEKP